MDEEVIKKLLNIYSELETKLLDEIVKHFKINEEFINSDFWRIAKLEELGILNNNIVNYIAEAVNKTPKEIEEALNKIGVDTLNINKLDKAYKDGFIKINPSILLENNIIENLINYSYNELNNRFLELSNKIEQGTREAYLNVVEKAYIQTSEGITYQEAIRNSLLELGDKGITTLTYKTIDDNGNIVGVRNYDVEGAVRRELITATHNLTNKINQRVAEELDVEYVYLSEHIKCRPQHFPWQGTIIKKEDLVKVTRYGEVDGMGGPNCKHYPTPYFGQARGNELKKISLEEATKQYNLSQKQRYIERGIRKWKRKERIFKNVEDKEYYKKCKEKVKEWQLRNREFTEKNKLRRDFSRENVEKMTKVSESDILRPDYIRINASNKYNLQSEIDAINSAILEMPTSIQKEIKNSNIEIFTKGQIKNNKGKVVENSFYNRITDTIHIYQGADKEEVIHEIGHLIETKWNILNDSKYIKVRSKGLENYNVNFVKKLDGYDNTIGIKNSKFVSGLQGKIYEHDLNGNTYFFSNGRINLNCLGDYFSEGFRQYYSNSEMLKNKDIELFKYIEGVIKNG